MLTVVCVNHNNYLGKGIEYVEKLGRALDRWLKRKHRRVCITNAPEAAGFDIMPAEDGKLGWWQKLTCFRPGLFTGRVMYIDLDSVITGSLDELADTKGIVDLHDWGWKTHTLGSGVMVWDAGEHAALYERYNQTVPMVYRGDQDFVTELGGWPILPAHWLRSYRYHSKDGIPKGCKVVAFHGRPKCHEVTTGWVPEHWI